MARRSWLLMSSRGRYPHLPKKLTYRSYLRGRALLLDKDSLIFTYQGVFQVRSVRFGEGVVFLQELQGLHKNKRKIQGSLLTGKELKANRSLGDVAFFAWNWKKLRLLVTVVNSLGWREPHFKQECWTLDWNLIGGTKGAIMKGQSITETRDKYRLHLRR